MTIQQVEHPMHVPHQQDSDVNAIPLELVVGLFAVDWDGKHPIGKTDRLKPPQIIPQLLKLTRETKMLRHKAHGSTPMPQLQDLAKRTFIAHNACEKRMHQLENEMQRMHRYSELNWQAFDGVLMPLWNIDEQIVGVHNALSAIRSKLETLKQTFSKDKGEVWQQQLETLQQELTAIENKHVIDGHFVAGPSTRNTLAIPRGQAMCFSMLHRCHRLASQLLDREINVDFSLAHVYKALVDICSDLAQIRNSYTVHPRISNREELQMHYHEKLLAIDQSQVDGHFVDADGRIVSGQAQLREALEKGYDLIHECVVLEEESGPGSPDDILEGLIQARDNIAAVANSGIQTVTSFLGFQTLVSPFNDALKYVVGKGNDASTRMKSLVSSGLSHASRIAELLEQVDPALEVIYARLNDIKTRLKHIRNTINESWFQETATSAELKDYCEEMVSIQCELKALDKYRLQKVEASRFPLSGNQLLKSLHDECMALSIELVLKVGKYRWTRVVLVRPIQLMRNIIWQLLFNNWY